MDQLSTIRPATRANIEAVARLHRAVRTACLPYLPRLHASEGGHVGRRPLGAGSGLTARRDYCGTAAIEGKILRMDMRVLTLSLG